MSVDVIALLREAKREHRYCEDSWYSCPKDSDGCCDESQGDRCNCGADEWNARIDAALTALDWRSEPDAPGWWWLRCNDGEDRVVSVAYSGGKLGIGKDGCADPLGCFDYLEPRWAPVAPAPKERT